MKTLSYLIQLYIRTHAPSFHKDFKVLYEGKSFIKYERNHKGIRQDVTIFKTSDKCTRLVYSNSLSTVTEDFFDYRTFKSIYALCQHLEHISPRT